MIMNYYYRVILIVEIIIGAHIVQRIKDISLLTRSRVTRHIHHEYHLLGSIVNY